VHGWLAAGIAALSLLPLGAAAAGLGGFKTVYLLPMSNGLDQYLAVQLTTGSVLQVVADPTKADVIFTDHLGGSFEQTLDDLYADKPKTDDPAAADKSDDSSKGFTKSGMQGQRGRGTIFLVDRKSRAVLWSNYEEPKYPTPEGMRHAASRIAGKLSQALKGK
jgi:hypothetical protein